MKKKQGFAGMFFSWFMKAVVVLLGILIVAMAIFLLRNIIKTKNNNNAKQDEAVLADTQTDALLTASDTDSQLTTATESASTTESVKRNTGASILVLNGTGKAGVASAWKAKLESEGYTNVKIGDYAPTGGGVTPATKLFVKAESEGQDLAADSAGATVEVGTLDSNTAIGTDGNKIDTSAIDIVMVIGQNDASILNQK